ncbi:Gfo/Idh/MocA family protein [Streptomyces sedi]|uniref:Gfo/Idh/MocA family oxidoreductase n=1 Tax=Streptomyces sedi TaxID=555059 RepID=A0A5C4V3V9_9ACTN|nr:Gfo/Idh/MocA family oxidoreductase [Streptomyces sedi]TNM29759.1 Gfo/Idh/MocA family oxidoreductase [Streptomyces sedi]
MADEQAGLAGRPVRWGILATGGIADRFVSDVAKLPDAEIVAVGSRTAESAERFAGRHGIARAHGSWAALAEDPGVDVVYVATPHSAHAEPVRLCLEAGTPVLCEKPFTLNAAQATELVELARERGVFLMEAMWTYCSPVVRRMMGVIAEGAIGEVRSVHVDFGFVAPTDPAHRLRDPKLGGGALLDLGVYPVAFAQLVLGEPSEVRAWAAMSGGTDENTGLLLGYESGAVAALTCSFVADTARTAVVTGSRGRIEVPRGFLHPESFVLHRAGADAPEEFTAPGPAVSYAHEAAEVGRALRAGELESPLVPLDGTLAVMRTLDAARREIGLRYPGE